MSTIIRKTKDIVQDGEVWCSAFSHVLPLDFPGHINSGSKEEQRAFLQQMFDLEIMQENCNTIATEYGNDRCDKGPEGSGEYEYDSAENPKFESRWFGFVKMGYDDYFNDEYTTNGNTNFFIGGCDTPEEAFFVCGFDTPEEAHSATHRWLQKHSWGFEDDGTFYGRNDGDGDNGWSKDNRKFAYHGEGNYWMAQILQLDVVTSTI